MLALSWLLHQWFDGMCTVESTTGAQNIPIIAIKPPESLDNLTKSFMGEPSELRARVEVSVICFNEVAANCVAPYIKEGSVRVS